MSNLLPFVFEHLAEFKERKPLFSSLECTMLLQQVYLSAVEGICLTKYRRVQLAIGEIQSMMLFIKFNSRPQRRLWSVVFFSFLKVLGIILESVAGPPLTRHRTPARLIASLNEWWSMFDDTFFFLLKNLGVPRCERKWWRWWPKRRRGPKHQWCHFVSNLDFQHRHLNVQIEILS